MYEFDKDLNKKLIVEINKVLDKLGVDYKDLSEAMYHLDNSFAFRILNNQNMMRLSTFVKVCAAVQKINEKQKGKFEKADLLPSSFLKKIGY